MKVSIIAKGNLKGKYSNPARGLNALLHRGFADVGDSEFVRKHDVFVDRKT